MLRDYRRPATRTNEIWAMDFVHGQLATGRKLHGRMQKPNGFLRLRFLYPAKWPHTISTR